MQGGRGCSPYTKPLRDRTSSVIKVMRATLHTAGLLDIEISKQKFSFLVSFIHMVESVANMYMYCFMSYIDRQ